MKYNITSAIVVYKNDMVVLKRAIESFLSTDLNVRLYIVDNSPTDEIKFLCKDDKIEYIFNNKNIGFGAAHNIIMNDAYKLGKYHLVLNPDIYFKKGIIEELFNYMENNSSIDLVLPDVLYPNGDRQYLPKLLPTMSNLLIRRFPFSKKILERKNFLYEMKFVDYLNPFEIAIASGCFSFFRSSLINKGVLYDDRYFMYFEDFDISRQVQKYSKIMCYPQVQVYHEYERGSHKSKRLFMIFIKSLFSYFKKWGFFFDRERNMINKRIIKLNTK